MSQCLQYHHLKIKNKHGGYRGKISMKKFCESLKRHAMNITNSLKIKLLRNGQ